MASQLNYFGESFRARDPVTDLTQRFVTIDSTGRLTLCQSGEFAEGVIESTTAVGDMPAPVSFVGITKVVVDGAYPIGTYVCAGTDGIATVATLTTLQYVRGKLLEASGASGDIVTIRLIDDQVGAMGITGLQGPQGNTGITGQKGATGVQGQTGLGATGLQGQTGVQGDTGVQGQTGLGVTGLVGATGLQGSQGDTGVQGQTGIQGDTGVQGNTGVQGETGVGP